MLAAVTSWWLLLVGLAAVAAAWFYTGGSRPYGYRALGEVSVFVFFGLVAVVGTAYVQMRYFTWLPVAAAVPVGLLACALLVINNLRDIPTDSQTGKKTLAVVLGDRRTRVLYVDCVVLPFCVAIALAPTSPLSLIALAALPFAFIPIRGGAPGRRRTRPDRRPRPDGAAAARLRGPVHGGSRDPRVISVTPAASTG